ncbi:MAG: GNAT family N-acetyltransferase [Sporolactobacillus sp.]
MELKEGKNRYYFEFEDGHLAGEVTYSFYHPDVISLDHTYVDPALRGQHLAGQLVQAVVDKAKREGWKIIPACSYAKARFAHNEAYQKIEFHG